MYEHFEELLQTLTWNSQDVQTLQEPFPYLTQKITSNF